MNAPLHNTRPATSTPRPGAAAGRVLALTALLAALALHGAPAASALPQRGDTFCDTCTLGASGEGTLSDPGAVAVSQSTGDVYVLDRGHSRIVQYGPQGQFISAWGWGVNAHGSKSSYEVCTSECRAGADHGGFQLSGAQAIAVDDCTHDGSPCTTAEDPSVGDLYVIAPREHEQEAYEALEKYSPDGRQLERATKIPYQEDGESEKLEELEAAETHGLAVGSEGTPWLYYEEALYPLNNATLKQPSPQQPLTFTLAGEPANGLALDAHGDFYLAQTLPAGAARTVISKWKTVQSDADQPELQEVSEELDGQDTSGVAVDPDRGEVYLDNLTGVSSFAQTGTLIQTFGSPASEPTAPEHLQAGSGVALDAQTRDLYVADSAADHIDVYSPEAPAAPSIESLSVQEVSSVAAQLDATVDPRGSSEPTSWYFEYGTAPCPAACTRVPGGELGGQGFGEEGFGEQALSVHLDAATGAPLAPATTYHYRLTAENEHGHTASTEGSFSTPAAKGDLLADEREWELVSPAQKSGVLIEPLSEGGAVIQAAADGDAFTYVAAAPIGQTEGSRSFESTQMLSTRGTGGWESQDIVTPNEHGIGLGQSIGSEYRFFSEDLALALVQPFFTARLAEPPLSPPLTAREEGDGPSEGQENTIYLRDDRPLAPQQPVEAASYRAAENNGEAMENPGYLPLVDDTNVFEGAQFGFPYGGNPALAFRGGTPDLGHVVISSFLEGKPGCTPQELGCTAGLYEWNAGEPALRYVSILPPPSGEPVGATAQLGSYSASVRHAISDDGSRIVFSDSAATQQHLYLRDTASEQTVQLDQLQAGSGEGPENAEFQTASADGSRVFFTDSQRLTPGSGASQEQPDLYVCEVLEDPSTHRLQGCNLTDLTSAYETSAHTLESANVQGLVLGASEDGSYVYFLAAGVLSETPNAQHETPAPGGTFCSTKGHPQVTCNLYVEHYGSEPGNPGWPKHPTFIAGLSNEDLPDWFYTPVGGPSKPPGIREFELRLTSRVSPDGRYLAFMSDRELTGYDNVDSDPEAQGAHDEEVFLYAAPEQHGGPGRLICPSCDPTGARPSGVLEPPKGTSTPEGVGLLVDRQQTWAGRWLAASLPAPTALAAGGKPPYTLYQSRYLSDSGRLFFDSPADLVPEATNAKEDVYEYEPLGVPSGSHGCTGQGPTFDAPLEGCLGLISSGTSTRESAFLDASQTGGEGPHSETLSEGGGDVFFLSAAPLSPQDTDSDFDVYDAHECTLGSPCLIPPEERTPEACESTASCRSSTLTASSLGTPASARPGAAGNLTPQQGVLPQKESDKPKPPTRAQKLAKALKACRAAHRRSHEKRLACERQARKRYAPAGRARKATRKGRR